MKDAETRAFESHGYLLFRDKKPKLKAAAESMTWRSVSWPCGVGRDTERPVSPAWLPAADEAPAELLPRAWAPQSDRSPQETRP